jgi:hypothetical protein
VDGSGHPPEHVSLTVPAGSDQLGAIRGFLEAVARHHGVDEERIEELKIAVTEVCAGVPPAGTGGRIVLEARPVDDGLEVTLVGVPRIDDVADRDGVGAYRRQLIEALIPDARFGTSGETTEVRFTVSPPA